jgi:hypothetical protein
MDLLVGLEELVSINWFNQPIINNVIHIQVETLSAFAGVLVYFQVHCIVVGEACVRWSEVDCVRWCHTSPALEGNYVGNMLKLECSD